MQKLFGTHNKRALKKIQPLVDRINEIYASYHELSDEQLKAKTGEFKERLRNGETTDDLLCEAFAVVKDACRRLKESNKPEENTVEVTGHRVKWEMIPFDVQLIGGIVLHQGNIAEMATGEGKTLVATMPLYLNALTGKNVQLITVNDYLARRDSQWVGHVLQWLGLTVGCLQNNMTPSQRREQYACDVTYGTNSEFGFDYLRDMGMCTDAKNLVQRDYFYAIVDEIDSILIDEARTPLIIAGPAKVSTHMFDKVKPQVEALYARQFRLMADWMQQAKAILDRSEATEDEKEEAYMNLAKVQLGMPKHKLLMRFLEDPQVRKALDRIDVELHNDNNRGYLQEVEGTMYFTIDERGGEADLTEMGRQFLSPSDPEAFVIPDLPSIFSEIEGDSSMNEGEKLEKRKVAQDEYNKKSEIIHNISQLLRAYCLFEKDVHYVVQDNKVVIVDEFTGRPQPGRRFSEGLHQALEAKENVKIERETQTLASITIQNYFRMYSKLSGMTGTAETEATEFKSIYDLDVVVIPTNRPCIRQDFNDRVFKTQREKYNAILEEITECHAKGQPVLVGTISVEVSELLSRLLTRRNIIHNVLNAKHHESEAEIVARAGQFGAVTIATNMAGRGTDIKLGPGVKELGGLHVIGSERHDARRIDRQLRGRCARQGDPGSSRFYVSLEDNLMRLFGSERIGNIMEKLGLKEGEELSHPWLSKTIENAQRRVEQQHFGIRKRTLEYDDVMNKQRASIYTIRHDILVTDDPKSKVMDFIYTAVSERVENAFNSRGRHSNLDLIEVKNWLGRTIPIGFNDAAFTGEDAITMTHAIMARIDEAYAIKESNEVPELSRWLERYIILNAIDNLYQEHLYNMDSLRQSVQLRSYGQRDPLVEYKQEAYTLYSDLMNSIKDQVSTNAFRLSVVVQRPPMQPVNMPASEGALPEGGNDEAKKPEAPKAPAFAFRVPPMMEPPRSATAMHASLPQFGGLDGQGQSPQATGTTNTTIRREAPKVGRNDACPCGSGKKYKNCCGR